MKNIAELLAGIFCLELAQLLLALGLGWPCIIAALAGVLLAASGLMGASQSDK